MLSKSPQHPKPPGKHRAPDKCTKIVRICVEQGGRDLAAHQFRAELCTKSREPRQQVPKRGRDRIRFALDAQFNVPPKFWVVHTGQAEHLDRVLAFDLLHERGETFDPDRPDNVHRFNMGVFPVGARIIANPYNKIPGFSCDGPGGGTVHFVPGFPVMAWPMIEWVLDTHCRSLHGQRSQRERSVIVYGSMEAKLTPLMEEVERRFADVRVFSLPCVDEQHVHGRHIELGVKGPAEVVEEAFVVLRQGLDALHSRCGPELVR